MASKLLVASASIATATTEDSGECHRLFSSVRSLHVRSGNIFSCSSSSSSSGILQLRLPGYGSRETRSCAGFSVGCTQASLLHDIVDLRHLHKERGKRTAFGFMTEDKLSDRSRKEQLESRIYHGSVPCHHWDREACVAYINKQIGGRYREGRVNVCGCSLWNPVKRGFSMAENDEKQRERQRQRALFSLCARAMVASHMIQSPLLSFLWANWPNMVKELSAGGQGGGKTNPAYWEQHGNRELDHASFCYPSCWKVLLLGFILGTMVSITLTSAVSLGALLDLCFWLCLLCNLLYLAACTVQAVFVAVMFITRGGITSFCKSFNTALQKNVCMSFCRRLFAGVNTLLACVLRVNGCPKRKAQTLHFSVSSLWSRPSTKV